LKNLRLGSRLAGRARRSGFDDGYLSPAARSSFVIQRLENSRRQNIPDAAIVSRRHSRLLRSPCEIRLLQICTLPARVHHEGQSRRRPEDEPRHVSDSVGGSAKKNRAHRVQCLDPEPFRRVWQRRARQRGAAIWKHCRTEETCPQPCGQVYKMMLECCERSEGHQDNPAAHEPSCVSLQVTAICLP
jgi:hypothetical protein